ncbi:MAG: penicillin-binding transpeptidase domain-containing protein [Christensenellales bacterium]
MAVPKISNRKRFVVVLLAITFLFFVLLGRTGYIMLIQGSWLQQKAMNQWTRKVTVQAKRGSILDRNMEVLAQSASVDTVLLRPNSIEQPDEVANWLSEILEMDRDEIYQKATDKEKSEVWLKRQITNEQSDAIRELDLAGVAFTTDTKRYYPFNDFLAQTLGYTTVDGVGQEGLEAGYEKYLKGTNGSIMTETDKNGNTIALGEEYNIAAVDGVDLVLTVDYVIQSFLENALDQAVEKSQAKSAQGIVMNPQTGEILALGTSPDFDLNNVPRDDLDTLRALSRNLVVADAYEPGSTFKIFTAAAGLEQGAIDLNSRFYCSGSKIVMGDRVKCWKTHGSQTLIEAVENSCNVAFMDIGAMVGIESMYDYLYGFGFGEKTNVGLSAESSGIVRHIKYITEADLARISFGQSIAVTPLQLASAACAVVNGGSLMQPTLVSKMVDAEGNVVQEYEPAVVRQVVSEATSATMRQLLESVVADGSGRFSQIEGYRVGGKTGTAQKYDETGKVAVGKNISSFLGFVPADDPQLLCLILVDEPGVPVTFGSVVAAPHVQDVLENSLKYLHIAPDYSVNEAEQETVPNVAGLSLEAAVSALMAANLEYEASGTGTVVSQMPEAGEKVSAGTPVALYMSEADAVVPEGTEAAVVPNVLGMGVAAAKEKMAAAGLEIAVSGSGKAYYQEPLADREVTKGTVITVRFQEDDLEGRED